MPPPAPKAIEMHSVVLEMEYVDFLIDKQPIKCDLPNALSFYAFYAKNT
jgi:hypothetical protein